MIGYTCAYLRYYYPVEFITAYLNAAANDEDILMGTQLAKQLGINMLSPKFGYSRSAYFCDAENKNIYKGIGSIKNLSEKAADGIVPLYDKKYDDFIDLLFDIKETPTNSRMLDILIKISFFSDYSDINKLLSITQTFDALYSKKSIKKDSPLITTYGESIIREYSQSETETHIDEIDIEAFKAHRGISAIEDCDKFKYVKNEDGSKDKVPNGISFTKLFKKYEVTEEERQRFATKTVYGKFDNINIRGLLKHIFSTLEVKPCSVSEQIAYEKEYLGYIDYINPQLSKRIFVVTELNDKYSPKFNAYCLNNGKVVEMKVRKRRKPKDPKVKTSFYEKPFKDSDIIYLKSWGQEPKMKKVDDHWETDYSTMVNWMYDYDIVHL